MNKFDKVEFKNIGIAEFLDLNYDKRETVEMYFGEVGVVMRAGEDMAEVAFSTGLETLDKGLLKKVEEKRDTVYLVIFYQDNELKVLPFSTYALAEGEEENLGNYINVENITIKEIFNE